MQVGSPLQTPGIFNAVASQCYLGHHHPDTQLHHSSLCLLPLLLPMTTCRPLGLRSALTLRSLSLLMPHPLRTVRTSNTLNGLHLKYLLTPPLHLPVPIPFNTEDLISKLFQTFIAFAACSTDLLSVDPNDLGTGSLDTLFLCLDLDSRM